MPELPTGPIYSPFLDNLRPRLCRHRDKPIRHGSRQLSADRFSFFPLNLKRQNSPSSSSSLDSLENDWPAPHSLHIYKEHLHWSTSAIPKQFTVITCSKHGFLITRGHISRNPQLTVFTCKHENLINTRCGNEAYGCFICFQEVTLMIQV